MMVDTMPKTIQPPQRHLHQHLSHQQRTSESSSSSHNGGVDISVLLSSSSSNHHNRRIVPKVHVVYEGSGETVEEHVPSHVRDNSIATVQLSQYGHPHHVTPTKSNSHGIQVTGHELIDGRRLVLHATAGEASGHKSNNVVSAEQQQRQATVQVSDTELNNLLEEFQNRHSKLGGLLLDMELRDLMQCCSETPSLTSKQNGVTTTATTQTTANQQKRRSKTLPKLNINAIGHEVLDIASNTSTDHYMSTLTPTRIQQGRYHSSPYCDQPLSPFSPNNPKMKPMCNLVSPYKCSFPLQDVFKGLTPMTTASAATSNTHSPSTPPDDLIASEFEKAMASLRDTIGKISSSDHQMNDTDFDTTCRQEIHNKAKRRITFA
jgi:hypothetical protein